ncbi:DJ-1/PfpI family protein [Streptomyces sp. NPDC059009]|uniref:DJ-1/PfpI family protein n=1 Tax=Streptomyces sp. NPDC059009 TaxID=3346694 RepID=UPI0036A9C427
MQRRNILRTGAVATAATALGLGTSLTTASAAAPGAERKRERARELRVHTVLFDAVEEQDFAGPIEVLGILADADKHRIKQSFVTADGPRTVRTSSGMHIDVRDPWAPEDADVLLVPGGGYGKGSGVDDEIKRGILPRALAKAERPGLIMGGICTGVMVMSAAKITRGRPCTTHFAAREDLAEQGGKLTYGRVVDDGDLITCGGVTSGLDLALWLVERLYGPQAALRAEMVLEYERRGTVWRSKS